MRGGCVGILDGNGKFLPLVVPESSYAFDGVSLAHGPKKTKITERLVAAGVYIERSSQAARDIAYGAGCESFSTVVLVNEDPK